MVIVFVVVYNWTRSQYYIPSQDTNFCSPARRIWGRRISQLKPVWNTQLLSLKQIQNQKQARGAETKPDPSTTPGSSKRPRRHQVGWALQRTSSLICKSTWMSRLLHLQPVILVEASLRFVPSARALISVCHIPSLGFISRCQTVNQELSETLRKSMSVQPWLCALLSQVPPWKQKFLGLFFWSRIEYNCR